MLAMLALNCLTAVKSDLVELNIAFGNVKVKYYIIIPQLFALSKNLTPH